MGDLINEDILIRIDGYVKMMHFLKEELELYSLFGIGVIPMLDQLEEI